MAVVLKNKEKSPAPGVEKAPPYGPGAEKKMEMLRALPSLLLTHPVQGIWGYMVIAEG